MATATSTGAGQVDVPGYRGPERRSASEEKREGYLVERKLRMEVVNALGRKALYFLGTIALMLAIWWVGRIEANREQAQQSAVKLDTLVKTVDDLAGVVKKGEERERETTTRRAEKDAAMLVQLERLNGQIELLREEQRQRMETMLRGNR